MIIAYITDQTTQTVTQTGLGHRGRMFLAAESFHPVGDTGGHVVVALRHLLCHDEASRRNQMRWNERAAEYKRMNKIATILCVLVFSASGVFAQDNARAIVEKAIQAQEGEAQIAKLRRMRIKAEGTAALVPGQPDLPFTIEDTWQMPDRYKSSSTFQITGQKYAQIQVIDGDKGWIQMNGQTLDLPKEAVAEMKEQKYAEDLDRLAFLKETGVELSAIDSIRVEGKTAAGVLLKSKEHRDVKLYFDTTSGVLVKREHRLLDPASGKVVLQEVIFSDYQEKDGLKHYKKIIGFRDGKKVFDATVTEMEFFDKLDEKIFAKP